MRPPRHALLALLALAACGPVPPELQPVTLPPSALPQGAGDPARGAIISSSYVFGQPSSVAGNPAAAAQALAQLEFLTVELNGGRWHGLDGLVVPMLRQGRAEARSAFGLDPAATPQRATDALFGTAAALRAGDRAGAAAALAPLTGPDRAEGTLQRLAAMPYLPQAAAATSRARDSMLRNDQDDGNRRWRF